MTPVHHIHRNIVDDLNSMGVRIRELPSVILAEPITEDHRRIENQEVEHTVVPFYLSMDGAVVVDSSYFGDFTLLAPCMISENVERFFGQIKRPSSIVFCDLLLSLIHAGVIATYIHIDSKIELEIIEDDRIRVSGEHVYYTSERNSSSFVFEVSLRADGSLFLISKPVV